MLTAPKPSPSMTPLERELLAENQRLLRMIDEAKGQLYEANEREKALRRSLDERGA